MLALWLHDIARIRGLEGDHAIAGAEAARLFLLGRGCFDHPAMELIDEVIRTHSCRVGQMPESPEAKILATADAMSHFGEFYLAVATTSGKSVEEFRTWALEKLDRDFNIKIQFDFAREQVKGRYNIIGRFILMRG